MRYGFAQTATHFYVFGGVSNGTRVPDVNRMDLATGMWQSRAPMPFTSEAPTCALMASTGIVYCTEGDTGSGFASYNIATDTWTPLASIPGGDHYGSASGAFNGKVFVAGGTTGFVSAVQVYDVASNMWSAGTAAPNDFLLAGYQQVGQFLYVVGGFEASGPVAKVSAELSSVLNRGQQSKQPKVPMANNTTTWRLDMSSAPGVWSVGPAFTAGRADFGLAYDAGTNKLYALGGDSPGGGFFDSTNAVDELSVASWPAGAWMPSPPNLILPNRQANQAGFYGSGQIWSVGGLVGQTFQFLAEVQRRSNGGAPCGTPTATPTATSTATAGTPTPTPTASPTCMPGGQITTLFASNNFGNPGGANYFDLTVASNPITVTSLDINTAETVAFSNVQIYVLPGMTSQGNETNMALWTQVATGSGTGAGVDLPTHVTLSNPFVLNAGTLYGIAVVADPAITLHYTNGNGSNQNYSNADLALFLGSATNVPFTAPVFSPRVWNGTIYYTGGPCGSPTPTPTATATPTTTATGTPSPTPTCGPAAWQSGPTQPPARYAFQGALGTDNMLYIAGGQTADSVPTVYDQVSRYNPTTNTWSNVAPLPVALGQATTGAANGKIYVAGGFIGGTSVTNALRIYDIATNTWTSGANMPTSPGVEAAAGAVVNGKFYVMGGDDFNNGLNTNFIYDIATNTWSTGATLPDNRTNTYGTAYNGLIYVYGGVILPAFTTTDTLLRYDPVANSWTNLGSAGTGGLGNYGGISPFGTGQLLITDGADASGASTTATHIFTISSGTFSAGPAMIGNRAGHAQGTLPDGRVLVADGFNTASTTVSTVELLTAPCPSATPTATPTATRTPTATPTAHHRLQRRRPRERRLQPRQPQLRPRRREHRRQRRQPRPQPLQRLRPRSDIRRRPGRSRRLVRQEGANWNR